MLTNVSWSAYWTFIIVSNLFYYSYVGFKFFLPALRLAHSAGRPGEELGPAIADDCAREITAYLSQITGDDASTNKNEILDSVGRIIQKYSPLKDSSYQAAINRLIRFECMDKCAVHVDEAEVRRVWKV